MKESHESTTDVGQHVSTVCQSHTVKKDNHILRPMQNLPPLPGKILHFVAFLIAVGISLVASGGDVLLVIVNFILVIVWWWFSSSC